MTWVAAQTTPKKENRKVLAKKNLHQKGIRCRKIKHTMRKLDTKLSDSFWNQNAF